VAAAFVLFRVGFSAATVGAGAASFGASLPSSSRRTARRRTTVGLMRSVTTFCCFSFSIARLTRSASAGSISLM
jgi:hypothetical protein